MAVLFKVSLIMLANPITIVIAMPIDTIPPVRVLYSF